MKKNILILSSVLALSATTAMAQCGFTGLNASYCINDAAATIVPSGAGTLSGPGVTGTTFDPAAAGVGSHMVTYQEGDPTIYTVDQTGTFAPVAGSGTAVILSDDDFSGTLPIGFTFNFFGVDYTDFYISSNGFITFSNTGDDGCCSGDVLPNGSSTLENMIAFGWEDLYPPGNGVVEYFTTGTAPNRMLIVNFTDVPFCCGSTADVTSQVILYEMSNIIEIHSTHMEAFSSGTQGIENVGGTIAYPVTGRNGASWGPVDNDYVAFIPDVCTYSELITVSENPTISLSANDEMLGNDGSVNLTILSGAAPFTFDWDNDGTGDNDDNNDLYGVTAGTYTVIMTDGTGCTASETITVGSQVGLEDLSGLTFSIEPNPSTGIFNVNVPEFTADATAHLLIVNTAGQRIISEVLSGTTTKVDMTSSPAGTYFVKVITEAGSTVKQIIIK